MDIEPTENRSANDGPDRSNKTEMGVMSPGAESFYDMGGVAFGGNGLTPINPSGSSGESRSLLFLASAARSLRLILSTSSCNHHSIVSSDVLDSDPCKGRQSGR